MGFPASFIFEDLRLRLSSEHGADGISRVVERLRPCWKQILKYWPLQNERGRVKEFGKIVQEVAGSADSSDLVTLDIKLRQIGVDFAVRAGITRSLIEAICGGDPESVYRTVLMVSEAPANQYVARIFNIVLIKLHIARDEFDAAIAVAKRDLSEMITPATQYYLYRSLAEKKKKGEVVVTGDICIDDLSDRFCSQPFDTISTGPSRWGGPPIAYYACHCPGTLPYPVGSSEAELTREKLWNGPEIQEIRRSVLDGDFTYCSRKICPYLMSGTLPTKNEVTDPRLRDIIDNRLTVLKTPPIQVTLGHDPSCNLACPSCRTELIAIKNDAREELDRSAQDVLLPLLADIDATITISTDGDPFASKHYRNLMRSFDSERHSKLKILLITNGILFTETEWNSLGYAQHMILTVGVSIDGACRETYEDLRKPGKWDVITENMEFLAKLRRQQKLSYLCLQFVVQRKNYREMIDFVKLAKQWDVDLIRFIRLVNIGTYKIEEFNDHDICDVAHPLFPNLLEILRDQTFSDSIVDMHTVKPIQDMAMSLGRKAAKAAPSHWSKIRDGTTNIARKINLGWFE